MKTNRRVLVIYDPSQAGITAHVRGFHFQRAFTDRGWRLDFLAYTPPPNDSPRRSWRELDISLRARRYGIVYLLKVSSLTLLRRLKNIARAQVVFDLTDSLWREEVGGSVWGALDTILAESDAVFTCNSYDTSYGTKSNRRTLCLPSYANVEEFQRVRAGMPPRVDGPLRLGWIGSASTTQGIRNLAVPLDRLAERWPGLELRVVGCRDERDLPAFRHLQVSLGPTNYDEHTMILEVLGMDIGIFPIVIDVDDYCVRGALKALNYMAGSVPCVCHRAGECARIIDDGKNGMLAETLEEWEEKLEQLVRDPTLRLAVGAAGLETVRAGYSFNGAVNNLEEAFLSVLRERRAISPFPAAGHFLLQLIRITAQTVYYALVPRTR